MSLLTNLTLASVVLTTTALSQSANKVLTTMPSSTVEHIADAIFRAENSHKHPYGVMIPCTSPRVVCINTIQHAWRDFEGDGARTRRNDLSLNIALGDKASLPFIQFLGSRYCPPSVDYVGYRNWTNNVWRIYNHGN